MTNHTAAAQDGIPVYSQNRYWGKGSEAGLLEANALLRREGLAAFERRYAGRFDYTLEENRADWRFPVMLDKRSAVLDIGAGMGRISIPLARVAGRVVAADLSFARLQYLKTRAELEGLSNIEPVLSDLYDLPFGENTFDLVVMNGVLEWVGKTERFAHPRLAQLEALRRCKKLLKPGGVLYIGIENRFALSYLRGIDHSGLRYTSYMPRFLADAYSRLRGRGRYDTYTYNRGGYARLLREAGFAESSFYLIYPGYNLPRIQIPYENLGALRYVIQVLMPGGGWKRAAVRLLAGTPLLRLYRALFFSYTIFARK